MSVASRRIHALHVRANRLRDTYIPRATQAADAHMLDFYQGEYAALVWVLSLLTSTRPSTAGAIIAALRVDREAKRWNGRSLTGAAAILQRQGIVWDDFAAGVASAVIAMEPPQDPARACPDTNGDDDPPAERTVCTSNGVIMSATCVGTAKGAPP